ncbi:MAG: amino acid permease [Verrucomicrobiota bacterium]
MTESHRRIGFYGAVFLVVANMLGTGIFTSTGFLIADLPSRSVVLIAWVVGGVIALLGAICYGALAKRLPESGGEYFFLSRTIHPAAGYVGGWISLLVGFSAPIAAAALALGAYTSAWFPEGWDVRWTGTAALLVFTGVHAIDVRRGISAQNVIVVLKIVLIFVFVAMAAGKMDRSSMPTPTPEGGSVSAGVFAVSLVWISFAFSGWNAAVYVGGEVRDPERTLPRAMIVGTLVVLALYLVLNVVFLYGAPAEAIAGKPEVARIVAEHLGGKGFADFTSGLIAVALLTSISAMMMAGPRVYARMAADGYLPAFIASDRPPARNAVLLQLVVALIMIWVPDFPDLAKYIGFTLGIGTALTVVGLIRLKMREPDKIHIPGWPWVPVLFIGFVGWVTVFGALRAKEASLWGALTILLGVVAWRLHPSRRDAETQSGE